MIRINIAITRGAVSRGTRLVTEMARRNVNVIRIRTIQGHAALRDVLREVEQDPPGSTLG